jgi:hypothetical protein
LSTRAFLPLAKNVRKLTQTSREITEIITRPGQHRLSSGVGAARPSVSVVSTASTIARLVALTPEDPAIHSDTS